jgi:Ca2+/H+ antiporter, TMEM165/GDT1 family
MLDAFATSTGLVALAEIGDKTQLLAIVLAAKYRKPVAILLGIFVATLLNHALAATAGYVLADWLNGPWLRFGVGVGFLAMAAWALIPDEKDGRMADRAGGVFLATLIAFFLVEIGDKTQIATALLAVRFENIVIVTLGTTVGMMLVNTPAVLLGEAGARFVPLVYVRAAASLVFALIGAWLIAVALGLLPAGALR